MPIYEFSPRELDQSLWGASRYRGGCRVHAPDEASARNILATWYARTSGDFDVNAPIATSPWLVEGLAVLIATTDVDQSQYREGLIEEFHPSSRHTQIGLENSGIVVPARWVAVNADEISRRGRATIEGASAKGEAVTFRRETSGLEGVSARGEAGSIQSGFTMRAAEVRANAGESDAGTARWTLPAPSISTLDQWPAAGTNPTILRDEGQGGASGIGETISSTGHADVNIEVPTDHLTQSDFAPDVQFDEVARERFATAPQDVISEAQKALTITVALHEILRDARSNSPEAGEAIALLIRQEGVLTDVIEALQSGGDHDSARTRLVDLSRDVRDSLLRNLASDGVMRGVLAISFLGLASVLGIHVSGAIATLIVGSFVGPEIVKALTPWVKKAKDE